MNKSESGRNRQLSFQTLMRFEQTLSAPFRRALDTGRVKLVSPAKAASDPESPLARALAGKRAVFERGQGLLVIPFTHNDEVLGLLSIHEVEAEQLTPATHPFLSSMVETAMDLVLLRQAAETEPVTGLANERALEESTASALAKLRPFRPGGTKALGREEESERALTVLALEPLGLDSLMDRYGRRFGEEILAECARRLAEDAPEDAVLARAPGAFLLLVEGGANPARKAAENVRRALEELSFKPDRGKALSPVIRVGGASVEASAVAALGLAGEAAALLKSRARRALECAARIESSQVLFFDEIVEKAGRIIELMPLDRVRIDLGRVHGLADGERFHVTGEPERGGGLESAAKAEIAVLKVGDAMSVAEVAVVSDPTWSLRVGDRLRRIGAEAAGAEADAVREVTVAGRRFRVVLDQVTGLACHRSFINIFAALANAADPFSALVIRVDGLEGLRQANGRLAADAIMSKLAELAGGILGEAAFTGRHSPDSLAAVLPGVSAEEAEGLAEQLAARFKKETERTISAGVGYHPCAGFTAAAALDNAAKALVHAGFFGPDTVTRFDEVSLNISGDALFAQGRMSEAVAEYEKALLLAPAEANVLNSLGVCYGHLGQMDKAVEFFEKALDAAPEDFMAHYNLGYALMAQGRGGQAKDRFESALGLNPDHADTLFQLGRLAQNEGRAAEAVELLAKASEQEDCRAAVHRHLGEALSMAQRHGEAEEAFNRALKINPNDAAALSGLAGLYLDRSANQEIALSLAKRARGLEPANPRHIRIVARALLETGQEDEAAKVLKKALMENDKDAYLTLQLAEVEKARGRKAASRDWYIRALALEPNLEAAQKGIAVLNAMEEDAEG